MSAFLAGLLVLSSAAAAEEDWWYLSVGGNPGDQNVVYADLASRSRDGDRVTIREASEHERPTDRANFSVRLRVVYDCRARTAQIIEVIFHGADGRERERSSGDPAPHGVGPGSIYDATMRFACGEGEGLEQLERLGLREHALLLFRERTDYLAAHPQEAR